MLNRDWHMANPMPRNPTEAQRIAWHLAHAEACACRPIPPRLAERMRALGIAVSRRPTDSASQSRSKP